MTKWFKLAAVILVAGALSGVSFSTVAFGQAEDMVNISPKTLNLVQFGGGEITVHVAMDYDEDATVELASSESSRIRAVVIFPDDRGDLVAKFSLKDVASIVEEGEVTLTLYVDGKKIGSDTIQVIFGGIKNGK